MWQYNSIAFQLQTYLGCPASDAELILVRWLDAKRCQQRALEGHCRGTGLPFLVPVYALLLWAPESYRTPSGVQPQQVLMAPLPVLSRWVLWVLQLASKQWLQQWPPWAASRRLASIPTGGFLCIKLDTLALWWRFSSLPVLPFILWPIAQPSNCGPVLTQGNLPNLFTAYWFPIFSMAWISQWSSLVIVTDQFSWEQNRW